MLVTSLQGGRSLVKGNLVRMLRWLKRQLARAGVLALMLSGAGVLVAAPTPVASVVFVGAHPDDDSLAAATLARWVARKGWRAAVISATRGEAGGNASGQESGAELGRLREQEQRRCLATLGIVDVSYLDCLDFGFTLSARRSEEQWRSCRPELRLLRQLARLRPDVIVTLNPEARGHGAHQHIARLVTEAFWKAPWRPSKLYYALEYGDRDYPEAVQVPVGEFAALEQQALRAYRSQGWDARVPEQPAAEPFLLAASRVPVPLREKGLEEGLDAPIELEVLPASSQPLLGSQLPVVVRVRSRRQRELTLPRPYLRGQPAQPGSFRLQPGQVREFPLSCRVQPSSRHLEAVCGPWSQFARVRPRPAITLELPGTPEGNDFARWQARFPHAQSPLWSRPEALIEETGGALPGRLLNHGSQDRWLRFQDQQIQLSPGEPLSVAVRLPPIFALGSHPLTICDDASNPLVDALLHVVPRAQIETATPAIGAFEKWSSRAYTISPQQRWDGPVQNAAALSGSFHVVADEGCLYLQVEVSDDEVRSDLAPEDNRAHWRSDAVEICLDRSAGSDTERSCKVGIVPFNRLGRPMAARDADARPGPVSWRCASRRTPTGYQVEIAIPWSECGAQPTVGKPLALNVLLYDGESGTRLAWSAAETVQARPWLWGRAYINSLWETRTPSSSQ